MCLWSKLWGMVRDLGRDAGGVQATFHHGRHARYWTGQGIGRGTSVCHACHHKHMTKSADQWPLTSQQSPLGPHTLWGGTKDKAYEYHQPGQELAEARGCGTQFWAWRVFLHPCSRLIGPRTKLCTKCNWAFWFRPCGSLQGGPWRGKQTPQQPLS